MSSTPAARALRAHRNVIARTIARTIAVTFFLTIVGASVVAGADPDPAAEVRATETAFAATMAARDHAAFTSFLSDETVFFGGGAVMRGKDAVSAAWKRFFEGDAPFHWAPEDVEVLDSGTLALSSGPVHDAQGTQIGVFTSIWRLEPDGKWRIVFDKGCPYCEEAAR